jgi:hypothetical protein
MAVRNVSITLAADDQRLVELAVTDGDAEAALEFLRRVVKPQVDVALKFG